MASEYSRHLSQTVTRGHKSNAEKGFWNGGPPPYGYKRMLCDSESNEIEILRTGQAKQLKNQKVKLVPGDLFEIAIIKEIFDKNNSKTLTG